MPMVKRDYFIYVEASEGEQKRSFAIAVDGTFYVDGVIVTDLDRIQEHARRMHNLMGKKEGE